MSRIVIFAGTTEGRRLSELLSRDGIVHDVCVATQCGADFMPEDPYARIQAGRMDAGQMSAFLREKRIGAGDYIVDATHPYAAEATVNIRTAAEQSGAEYLRVVRASEEYPDNRILTYDHMEELAKALNGVTGNILLTTGSKELGVYCANVTPETIERTVVRVLPTVESLELCRQAGIETRRILAAVGPFSMELNKAILTQYGIKHLVSKESGREGGFKDKIDAALALSVTCHIIRRPASEEGMDLASAYRALTGRDYACSRKRRIVLAGYGPGGEGTVTYETARDIRRADAVFGAGRLLEGLAAKEKYPMYLAKDIIPILKDHKNIRRAVILFTGDSGFYSGAEKMYAELRSWDEDLEIRIRPGISSVSCLAAKLGVSYHDAALFSLHGRKNPKTLQLLMDQIRYTERTFVLLSDDSDLRDIGSELLRRGLDCELSIGMDLSCPRERVIRCSPREAADFQSGGIITVCVVNRACERRPAMKVLRDEAFLRDKVPMTKENIRHISLLELGIREGDTVYDIGGGTGAVAIEAATLHPSVTVYTFERDPGACALIRENARRLGAYGVTVIEGEAPETFADIEPPDRVFIGGSGRRLKDMIDQIRSRKEGIRYVINAVTLETIGEVMDLLRVYETLTEDVRIMQIGCSKVTKAGDYHLLRAQNPVMIFSFVL